jgi:hypothetical protein
MCVAISTVHIFSLADSDYNAGDYISIVIQFVSIFSFLYIIGHSVVSKFIEPTAIRFQAMIPLFSIVSSCLFLIFYLSLQFYVHFTDIDRSTVTCSTAEQGINMCNIISQTLMYIAYYFIIFNFTFKVSVGYFSYIRLNCSVERPLLEWSLFRALLAISFCTAGLFLILLIGSNYAYLPFTQLTPYQICWFIPQVIHFYLTVPVGLSVAISGLIFLRFCYIIFRHRTRLGAQSGLLPRICLIVLISCITQSIPWLLGPLVAVSNIFTWLFTISNALEALWSLLLYRFILRLKLSSTSNVSHQNISDVTEMYNQSQVWRPRKQIDASTFIVPSREFENIQTLV